MVTRLSFFGIQGIYKFHGTLVTQTTSGVRKKSEDSDPIHIVSRPASMMAHALPTRFHSNDSSSAGLVHPRQQRTGRNFRRHESDEEPRPLSAVQSRACAKGRSQSVSPSTFTSLSVLGSSRLTSVTPGPAVNTPTRPCNEVFENRVKKHGAYKIWHRNAASELQTAYNSIYGLPLYGSVCFVGKKVPTHHDEMEDFIESEDAPAEDFTPSVLLDDPDVCTHVVKRFDGTASISLSLDAGLYVELSSAGKDDGDYAVINVNGTDVCLNQRGINLIIIVPPGVQSNIPRELLASRNELGMYAGTFDTHGLPEEAEKLAHFIALAPPGSVILGAVRDDGSKFLGSVGRAALRRIGVTIPKADNDDALARVVEQLPFERTRVLLTVCAKANARKCAHLLLKSGWDIHTRASHTMNTPLHDAIYQRNIEVAITLLDSGADPHLENKWAETPENIAQKKFGYSTLEEMIMAYSNHAQSILRYIGL